MKTTTVCSSHGELIVDSSSGTVISVDRFEKGDELIGTIFQIDVAEYKTNYKVTELPETVDILDVGYWFQPSAGDPQYEPPVQEWRDEVKNGRL